jgi:beta-glucosidase/6-phospho-beta-glucosidase/beta-galactosidase
MTAFATHAPFRSWFMGGFESSTLKFPDGRRIDVAERSGHLRLMREDYRMLRRLGIATVREALRWPEIDRSGGHDFAGFRAAIAAAAETGIQAIWDLCHFGYPDGIDFWGGAFVDRFAAYAALAGRTFRDHSDAVPIWTPVNEMSFWAFAAGDRGDFHPLARGRGREAKRQLARASIAAQEILLGIDHRARFVLPEPVIHIAPLAHRPQDRELAEGRRTAMFEAWDMVAGRLDPDLGGRPELLDIPGVNFYATNQWHMDGPVIPMGGAAYRPFHRILDEVWRRYGRPILVAETGAEGENGPGWLRYIAGEVRAAARLGVPVSGLCLYPVLDYPGWEDGRHCRCGLLTASGDWSSHGVDAAMAEELALAAALMPAGSVYPGDAFATSSEGAEEPVA